MLNLSAPIEKLAYVGPRFLARLKKLGIKTARDLLWHFPARYEDYSRILPISDLLLRSDLNNSGKVSIAGQITDINMARSWRRRMAIVNATVEDGTGAIRAVWFNQPYIADTLREGTMVSLSGKVSSDKNGLYLSSPSYEKISVLETGNWKLETDLTHTGRLVPIYPETEGLSSKYLRFLIKPLLGKMSARGGSALGGKTLPDPLPPELLAKYNFPKLAPALQAIHFPANLEQAERAKQRFAFEEILLFQLRVLRDHRQMQALKAPPIIFDKNLIARFVKSLPFELTNDQRVATYEILQDLERLFPMNRLLNGDVGSGKTVVALIAAYQTIYAGLQVVFMAPTEILARQHFQTITEMLVGISNFQFLPICKTNRGSSISRSEIGTISKPIPNSKLQIPNIRIGLLTGSGAKQFPTDKITNEKVSKKLMAQKIAKGEIDIIIGTHSVIQKGVKFASLGLVVIDEQHRFGINQRKALVRGSTRIDTQINAETKTDANKLLYEDLTYKIRGAIFTVYNNLGSGHKEIIYQKALVEELKSQKLNFDTEKSIPINYGGKKVGTYKADVIVENSVMLELKALSFVGETEKKQLWSYLKGSDYKIGFLVNFGPELIIKRVVYDFARNPRQSAFYPRESAQEMRIPHLLSMTATPIPRTLALTIYGDLDVSIIKEKPEGRQKIITKVVPHGKRENAHRFIEEQIKNGRQVFVICPRIQSSDTQINAENTLINADNNPRKSASNRRTSALSQMRLMWNDVRAVKEEYEKLSKKVFPHRRVAMLHGKMKPKEKDEIMQKFKNGHYDILVSTSVVEVGVDIPNAAIMMIESAERFGLAQLHQFRGRVGRDRHQSYCFLFTSSNDAPAGQRLRALEKTDDGFQLAEADLKIRGPGEFTGIKQSGIPDIAMASLTDLDLIKKARLEARLLLKNDPTLADYPLLAQRLSDVERLVHFE